MNAGTLANSKSGQAAVAILVGGVVVYFLFQKFAGAVGEQAKKAAGAIGNINAGTPYEGWGVVGTLGNAANRVSGGVLESVGSWIGGSAYDATEWVGGLFKFTDPSNPNTPSARKAAYSNSPVRAEDKANPLVSR